MTISLAAHLVRFAALSLRRLCVLPAFFALLVTMAFPLFGATYYVDFSGGDDQSDGLTPQTAWKHSPGDRNATGNPGTVELQPGDTIVLKGGVPYFGEIQWRVAGSEGKPITLDGNTAGTFGEGRAILDGARTITDWRRCASAEQVEGNARWNEIWYADLDVHFVNNTFVNTDSGTAWATGILGQRRGSPSPRRA